MQTFLTYSSFKYSAIILDNKRLNKQITEGRQILDILVFKPDSRWKNHPAVLMWKGYEFYLALYVQVCYSEWCIRLQKGRRQGKEDHKSWDWIRNNWYQIRYFSKSSKSPKWLGDERFHASHRSNLLRKDKEYYSKFGWKEPDNLPYFWPVKL